MVGKFRVISARVYKLSTKYGYGQQFEQLCNCFNVGSFKNVLHYWFRTSLRFFRLFYVNTGTSARVSVLVSSFFKVLTTTLLTCKNRPRNDL